MRYVYSTVAALFCLFAIVARAVDLPFVLIIISLMCAAIFLVLAVRQDMSNRPGRDRPLAVDDLDEKKRAEIQRLLDEGQYGTAVKQVRLWFRHVEHDEAEAIVQKFVA